MDVLIACECTGRVRRAFRGRGHNAWSNDIKPIEMVAHPDGIWVRLEDVEPLKEKARAAVNAPYEDILDMGLAQALRELEEALPPQ